MNSDMMHETQTFSADDEKQSDWETVTSPGSSFHMLAAATGNARSPTVTSCVGRTSRASVADERRRPIREGMSAT